MSLECLIAKDTFIIVKNYFALPLHNFPHGFEQSTACSQELKAHKTLCRGPLLDGTDSE